MDAAEIRIPDGFNREKAGTVTTNGYVSIYCCGRPYQAHQLAWFYMTGKWVPEIDHRDTIRSNNRWENLREATRAENRANSRCHKNNKLGIKGVRKYENKYQARIRAGGRELYLGYFATAELAASAYATAAKKYFGKFARTS